MPPKSPPPIDDMVPSAQPPEVKQPGWQTSSASKDAGKKLADQEAFTEKQPNVSGQISKEEEELGDVLKATAPPLAPAYTAPLPPPAKPPPAALDPLPLSQKAEAPLFPPSPGEG